MNRSWSRHETRQILGPERCRQQRLHREDGANPARTARIDGCRLGSELTYALTASPAAGSDFLTVAHRQENGDLGVTARNHRSDRPRLCTSADRICRIFDIAPGVDLPVRGQDRRPNQEMGIRRIRPGLYCDSSREKIGNSMFRGQSRHLDGRVIHDFTIIKQKNAGTRKSDSGNPTVFIPPEGCTQRVCAIMLR